MPLQAIGHPATAANVSRTVRCAFQRSCILTEPAAQLFFLNANDLASVALGAVVMAHHEASEPLRYPEQVAQGINSFTLPFRA